MTETNTEEAVHQLQQLWWLHDARWYQEVAQRFGFEAANDINRRALKFVATRIGRTVAKTLRKPIQEMDWDEVLAAFDMCPKLMWPPAMVDYHYKPTGPGTFEVSIFRSFALQMLQRAGTLEHYECPCLALREGWGEGLGLKLTENRIQQCLKNGGSSCTFIGRVEGFAPESCTAAGGCHHL